MVSLSISVNSSMIARVLPLPLGHTQTQRTSVEIHPAHQVAYAVVHPRADVAVAEGRINRTDQALNRGVELLAPEHR